MNKSYLSSIPPVVKNLLILNLIFWVASVALPGILTRMGLENNLSQYLGMHYWASEKFGLYQLITYMFMHGGFTHMFFNMFALFMFGPPLEYNWGSKRFLLFYIITGIGAALVQQLFWTIDYAPVLAAIDNAINSGSVLPIIPYEAKLRTVLDFGDIHSLNSVQALVYMKELFAAAPVTVGASGAVFGILLAFGWLFPNVELYLMFIPIPIKAKVAVILYALAELFFGVANFSGDNIAHFAHLGGMLFGAILILIWRRKKQF
ncbi:MAG: Rhomboid family protein [Bacteroidetes bacterium]|nr:Rhomboid family protein [Bacteroidota bacterium]